MCNSLVFALTLGMSLISTSGIAQPIPQMPDTVAKFLKRLASAKTVVYTVKDWGYDLFDAQPEIASFSVHNTYDVKAARPNRLSIQCSPGIEREVTLGGSRHRQFLNDPASVYINDGKRSIKYYPNIHVYTVGKGLDELTNAQDQSALNVQTYWVFYKNPLKGLQLDQESLAASSNTVVYSAIPASAPNTLKRIYFDRKTGDLTRTSDFEKDEKGGWKEISRKEFQFWEFSSQLPQTTFDVRPPSTYVSQDEYQRIHHLPRTPRLNQPNYGSQGIPSEIPKTILPGTERTNCRARTVRYNPTEFVTTQVAADNLCRSLS